MKKTLLYIFLFYTSLSLLTAQEIDKDSELIIAVFNNDSLSVQRLLAEGANVNAKTDEGVTPLMYAAQNGNTHFIELLIAHGAAVNEKPSDGFTALISACLFNNLDAAITLIENNADINAFNMYGATPLMVAAAYGYYIITDMLLYYGAEKELQDNGGNTALNIAATHGFEDIVALLIEKGADSNSKDENGYTPLMSAVVNNHLATMDSLLVRKPDLNMQSNKGYTAFMMSVRMRNDTIIQKLLKSNFDKTLRNNYGQNAAQIALLNKNRCLYNCLSENRGFATYLPYFKSIALNTGLSFTVKDVFFNYAIGLSDSKYGLHIFAGRSTRIGKKGILIQEQDNVYNQFNEKRFFYFGGLSKDLVLRYNYNSEKGINTGLSVVYSKSKLEGTNLILPAKTYIMPSIGFYYTIDYFTMKLSYEYIDFKTYKLSPHKINLSITSDINYRKNPKHKKTIYWIN